MSVILVLERHMWRGHNQSRTLTLDSFNERWMSFNITSPQSGSSTLHSHTFPSTREILKSSLLKRMAFILVFLDVLLLAAQAALYGLQKFQERGPLGREDSKEYSERRRRGYEGRGLRSGMEAAIRHFRVVSNRDTYPQSGFFVPTKGRGFRRK